MALQFAARVERKAPAQREPVEQEQVAGRRRQARTVGRRRQTVWALGVEEPLRVTLVLPRLARAHMVSKYRTENCGSLCPRAG